MLLEHPDGVKEGATECYWSKRRVPLSATGAP